MLTGAGPFATGSQAEPFLPKNAYIPNTLRNGLLPVRNAKETGHQGQSPLFRLNLLVVFGQVQMRLLICS